jgi:hypothetical protein
MGDLAEDKLLGYQTSSMRMVKPLLFLSNDQFSQINIH